MIRAKVVNIAAVVALFWKRGRVWLIAAALKTVEQRCSVGSNPTASAKLSEIDRVARYQPSKLRTRVRSPYLAPY